MPNYRIMAIFRSARHSVTHAGGRFSALVLALQEGTGRDWHLLFNDRKHYLGNLLCSMCMYYRGFAVFLVSQGRLYCNLTAYKA